MDNRMGCTVRAALAIPIRLSVFAACVFTLAFGVVFGIASSAKADELDMDALNKQAIQTLAVSGQKVTQVSFGGLHSAAITSNGDLYTWGRNDFG